jgi:hypothetical protein
VGQVSQRTLDLTQELAHVLDVPPCLQKIERDERRPSRQLAGRLIDFLEVPPEQRPLLLKIARGERMMETLPSTPQPVWPSQPESIPARLPVPSTPLVGREKELTEIAGCFRSALSFTHADGVRRSWERSWRRSASNARHIAKWRVFRSLMGVGAPGLLLTMEALNFSIAGSLDPTNQLLNYLSETVLIVLDNFEHLLDGVNTCMKSLARMSNCWCRVVLHLQAEWTMRSMACRPANRLIAELESNSAAMFFLQRARQTRADFTLIDEDRPALLRICQLVQGLPLALELAASWVRTLSCREIAREIERGLSFLTVTARDVPERHRSITAVFDHSWRLLSGEEQRVLRQLSVFRGGFTRAAAEQIAGAELQLLSSLVNKSLVQHNDMHASRQSAELIRQYSGMHLERTQQKTRNRARHSQYYLSLLKSRNRSRASAKERCSYLLLHR